MRVALTAFSLPPPPSSSRFKAWTMKGMEELGIALGEGTCLDGEVVRNRSWKRDIFMVFDCMSVGKVSCAHEPLQKRLAKLQRVRVFVYVCFFCVHVYTCLCRFLCLCMCLRMRLYLCLCLCLCLYRHP